jgi:hypothetical protein
MINDYKKLDLSKPLSFQDNLRKSIMVTTGSCIFGAIFFFVAYAVTSNIWLLSVGLVLVVSGIGFMFVIQNVQNKYADLMDDKPKDQAKNVE